MGTATPFDFIVLESDTSAIIDKMEDAIDHKLIERMNELLKGSHSTVAASSICALLAAVVSTICNGTPESVACHVHDTFARFSHSYLHALLKIAYEQGRYAGPMDMIPHDSEDDDDDTTVH